MRFPISAPDSSLGSWGLYFFYVKIRSLRVGAGMFAFSYLRIRIFPLGAGSFFQLRIRSLPVGSSIYFLRPPSKSWDWRYFLSQSPDSPCGRRNLPICIFPISESGVSPFGSWGLQFFYLEVRILLLGPGGYTFSAQNPDPPSESPDLYFFVSQNPDSLSGSWDLYFFLSQNPDSPSGSWHLYFS